MNNELRGLAFGAGCVSMLAALFLMNVTVTRGGYSAIILRGLAFAVAANLCFVIACWRSSIYWRIAAVIAFLPTVWVVADFWRRWA